MIDVSKLLVSTLRADAAFKALTGANTTDPRVYPYFNGGATIDNLTKKGYITYALTQDPERTNAIGGPVYSIAIWANTYDTAEAILDRLRVLFDCEGDPERVLTAPGTGTEYQSYFLNTHWAAQEDTKFAGINTQLRFGHSRV